MGVSDARHLEMYEQARAQWGDGPAETLMEMVVPPGQDIATRQGVEAASGRLQGMFKGLGAKFVVLEGTFVTLEVRFDALEARFAEMEERFAVLEERTTHLVTRSFVLTSQVPLYLLVVGLYLTG